jgi:DNA-binding CsgD family transcriptional regulator
MPIRSYNRLAEELTSADSLDAIHRICTEICRAYTFDYFYYGMKIPVSLTKPQLMTISGFPDAWMDRYKAQNYLAIDPVVRHCTTNATPLLWEDLAMQEKVDPKVVQFMEEASSFGLGCGMSFGLFSPSGRSGLFSLACQDNSQKTRTRIKSHLPFAFSLANYLHEAVQRTIEVCEVTEEFASLTPREKECLLWAAEGKSSWETAEILGVSDGTVVFHLRNVMAKLGVRTKHHAVARALSMGILAWNKDEKYSFTPKLNAWAQNLRWVQDTSKHY